MGLWLFGLYEQKVGVDDWMITRAPVVTKKNSKALQLQCRLPEIENAKPEGSLILSSQEYSNYFTSHTLVDHKRSIYAHLMFGQIGLQPRSPSKGTEQTNKDEKC